MRNKDLGTTDTGIDDEKLMLKILPAAFNWLSSMRDDDKLTAKSIVGDGVWSKFSKAEARRAGEIFSYLVSKGDLPFVHTDTQKSGSNWYRLRNDNDRPLPCPNF